jgi:hypothetical protein
VTWPIKHQWTWNTVTKTPVSGFGQVRISNWLYPKHTFEWTFGYLKGNPQMAESGLRQLVGFYNAVGGARDSFLYEATGDSTVASGFLGVGDQVTTNFQLQRPVGSGAFDIVQDPNPGNPLTVTVNGVAVPYTLQSFGVVQLSVPPAGGSLVQWSGSYFYRLHFVEDSLSLEQLLQDLWDNGGTSIKAESDLQ